jgi:hypothetical protein
MARELSIELNVELKNKMEFLNELLEFDKKSAAMYYESSLKIHVLQSRLMMWSVMMKSAT